MQFFKLAGRAAGLAICYPLICSLYLTGFAGNCLSEEPQKLIGQARFSVESFNFGVIPEGQTVSYSFELENIGNADLKILRTAATCGCTAVSSSVEAIAPGDRASIKVDFNSTGFSGKLKKLIRVYTNELEKPERVLTLEGEVQGQYQLSPGRVYFDNVLSSAGNQSQDISLRIRKDSGKSFKAVKSNSAHLSVQQLPDNSDSQFLVYNFRVTLDDKAPVGELRDRILIEMTDGKQSSFINLPVLARIQGSLSLDPKQLSFGLLQGTELIERKVRVINRGAESVDLLGVKSDHKAISTRIDVITPGKEFLLSVSLEPQKVGSDLRALIEIETSSASTPVLLLSVFAVVPPVRD